MPDDGVARRPAARVGEGRGVGEVGHPTQERVGDHGVLGVAATVVVIPHLEEEIPSLSWAAPRLLADAQVGRLLPGDQLIRPVCDDVLRLGPVVTVGVDRPAGLGPCWREPRDHGEVCGGLLQREADVRGVERLHADQAGVGDSATVVVLRVLDDGEHVGVARTCRRIQRPQDAVRDVARGHRDPVRPGHVVPQCEGVDQSVG